MASPPDLATPSPASGAAGPAGAAPQDRLQVLGQLRAEITAMLRHALATGREVPPALMRTALEALSPADGAPAPGAAARAASAGDPETLSRVHARLAALVAPARPGTLRLMHAARDTGALPLLGPMRNVRWLTLAAFCCLVAFMVVAQSPLIDGPALSSDLLALNGFQQVAVTALLLTAAGLGATFQALFTAQTYVSRATYDPLYDASYWIRIGLGLVSGLMLAVLIPMDSVNNAGSLQRPLLALLGGFSARLTHRVLQRLVDTVDSMFDSDRQQLVEQTRAHAQAEARQSATQTRLALARQLMGVQGELLAAAPDDAARQRLSAMLDELLAGAPASGPSAPPDPPGAPATPATLATPGTPGGPGGPGVPDEPGA